MNRRRFVVRRTQRDGTEEGDEVYITHTCDRCGGFLRTTAVENVIDNPAVVAFFYEHRIDNTAIPHWEVVEYAADEETRLVPDDPAEVRVTVRLAGDELTLSLDEEMRVRDVG